MLCSAIQHCIKGAFSQACDGHLREYFFFGHPKYTLLCSTIQCYGMLWNATQCYLERAFSGIQWLLPFLVAIEINESYNHDWFEKKDRKKTCYCWCVTNEYSNIYTVGFINYSCGSVQDDRCSSFSAVYNPPIWGTSQSKKLEDGMITLTSLSRIANFWKLDWRII